MGMLDLDADDIKEAVTRWQPGQVFSEADAQASLHTFLQSEFPRSRFHREHPVGNGFADIYAEFATWLGKGAEVIVEVKYQLTDRSECLRAIGQLHAYAHGSSAELVFVLCGPTRPDLISELKAQAARLVENRLFFKVHVLHKPIELRGLDGRFIPVQARSTTTKEFAYVRR